jgi:hypothetical protein
MEGEVKIEGEVGAIYIPLVRSQRNAEWMATPLLAITGPWCLRELVRWCTFYQVDESRMEAAKILARLDMQNHGHEVCWRPDSGQWR